jgi:Tyrosyl-DNA phosphodiesterase
MRERLAVRDALLSFAAGQSLRAALFLTYSFDGRWFDEAIVPDLCERPIDTMLVIRDRNAVATEASNVRYRKVNAARSAVFHPKLALLVSEDSARAVISSANLTRAGFERQSELGRVFDLAPSAFSDRTLFVSLLEYLETGLSTEVRGDSARDLTEVGHALRDILSRLRGAPSASAHALLHNYAQPIWTQMLDRIPHRTLRRAVIVSPFFEPDRKRPEDPALGADDGSIFARFFQDFTFQSPKDEPPIQVFFRQSEGRTELPVRKLAALGKQLAFFTQDEREQPLHAKLLMFEGAEGRGREPFVLVLHGSPNFTTAGLLNRPPHGNSELAVLTTFSTARNGLRRSASALGLDRGFTRVENLRALKTEPRGKPPTVRSQGIADTTYHVADRVLTVSLLDAVLPGTHIRVLLQRDGAWAKIGEASAGGLAEITLPVAGLAEIDGRTKLLELRGAILRVELVAADGSVVLSDTSPVNVDIPQEFCGMSLVGTALLTLDERIARAGAGAPPSYREQQKWLEARKAQDGSGTVLGVATHQADLDRFYRNVHHGLHGILTRAKRAPGSEFIVRRSLDEITRWAVEAAAEGETALTHECRLFLLDRLLQGAWAVIEGSAAGVRARAPAIAVDLGLQERVSRVLAWLENANEPALAL